MPSFEGLTPAKEAELKENLWKIAKFEKAIKKVIPSSSVFVFTQSLLTALVTAIDRPMRVPHMGGQSVHRNTGGPSLHLNT